MKFPLKPWLRLIVLTVFVGAVLAGQSVKAASPTEYQLKAAFLLNFAKFVDWPAAVFKTPQSQITICILGDDPFGRDLDDTVRGQTIGERTIAVRRINLSQRDDNCHILYLSYAERDKFDKVLAALKNHPCLTVGEEDEFSQAGGMISLLVEDKKIRFDVNLDVAERAGVKISSRLLKLARTVRDRRKN